MFVGGMAVGLYAFLNNKNGEFPEFGEAEATNKPLGTAGLVTAFAGRQSQPGTERGRRAGTAHGDEEAYLVRYRFALAAISRAISRSPSWRARVTAYSAVSRASAR